MNVLKTAHWYTNNLLLLLLKSIKTFLSYEMFYYYETKVIHKCNKI